MSILTSLRLNLVWITLTFFAPLFSFSGPGVPAVRLGSDAQPLTTACNCVSVISGQYFIAEPNLVIDGPAPLSYNLAYDSGILHDDGLAWGWHLQIPWRQGFFTQYKEKKQKKFLFSSEESENANIIYKSLGSPGSEIGFQVDNDTYDLVGYTNVSAGSISGQNNLHNNRAAYRGWSKDYHWGLFVLTTGSGSSRIYGVYKFLDRQQWRLVQEIQPNGQQVHYSYCGPHTLSRIHTTNPSGTLILNSINFLYDSAGYTAQASNGQSVRYNIDKVHVKCDYHNGYALDSHISHLREVIPSDGAPSSHKLCAPKGDTLRLQNNRREWRDGRFMNIIYQSDGKVSALQSPVGSDATPITVAAFAYGENYTCVADALGSSTVYRYSNEKRITSIEKCQLGAKPYTKKLFLWDLSLTGKGNLLSTALTDGQKALAYTSTVFSYDVAGNITQELLFGNLTGNGASLFSLGADLRPSTPTEQNESRYTYSTDGRNLCLSEKQSNGLLIRYAYKPGTNLLISKLTGDATRILSREFHEYDEDGFLITTIVDDGASPSSDQLQDVTVRTLKVITPRKESPAIGFPDQVVHKYWDPQMREEHQLRRIQYTYNAGDQIIQEEIYDAEDQFQYALTYAYDERRNLVAQSDALGRVTQFTYDINQNKLSEELVDIGIRTHFRYDLMNRLISKEEMHADGTRLVTSYKYDHLGNKKAEVDPFGNETRFVYDEFGRLIETILPLQETQTGPVASSIKQSYNPLDQCVSQTDALGHVTEMRYNIRNQLTAILNPDGTQERREYTLDGKLDKHWNIQGILTQYTYDVLGRPLEKTEYDANGKQLTKTISKYTGSQLTRVIDPIGVVTEYSYDGAGRKCKEVCAGSRTEYDYDVLGRHSRTKSWFGQGEKEYTVTIEEFDLLNRVTEERMEDAFGQLLHKKTYLYDIQGNRTHEHLYRSETEFSVNVVRYNSRKQPVEIIDALGVSTHVTYDLDHRNAIGQRVVLKTTTDPLGQQVAEIHDACGRVVSSTTRDAFGNQLAGYKQIYDLTGNPIRRIDDVWIGGELQGQRITTSSFDAGKRITHLCEAFGTSDERSTRFNYNRYGQLESTLLPGGISLHHTYDALGRLETYLASDNSFDYHYEYDAVGNVLRITDQLNDTVTTRTYDALHRVSSETLGNGLCLDYTHDDQGRLTGLILPDATTMHWTYAGRFLKEIQWLGGATPPLTTVYTARDLVGNVVAVVDTFGTAVENIQYGAFGEEKSLTKCVPSSRCPWRFSSKRLDEATGLTCFGRRYYDSALGRWLTPDPIGYKAGPNLYAYVHNSPLTHFDLYGLYSERNNPYRDGNYSFMGPVGRGTYNALLDPWGTSCRYGGYASQLGSSIWNRDFSSLAQGWDKIRGGRGNFFKERMGEIVTVVTLAPVAVAVRSAYTLEAGASYIGRVAYGLASQGVKSGMRWAFNRQSATGELTSEVQTAPASSMGQSFTKSNLRLGKQMHSSYKLGVPGFKEYRLPSGRRIDFFDPINSRIYELKPNNPRAVRLGQKQLESYLEEIKMVPEYKNTDFKTILETY